MFDLVGILSFYFPINLNLKNFLGVMKMKQIDQLFWVRVVLGFIAGLISGIMTFFNYMAYIGLLLALMMYIVSYFIAKYMIKLDLPKDSSYKIFTTGLGSFIILWLFTWIIYYTISINL